MTVVESQWRSFLQLYYHQLRRPTSSLNKRPNSSPFGKFNLHAAIIPAISPLKQFLSLLTVYHVILGPPHHYQNARPTHRFSPSPNLEVTCTILLLESTSSPASSRLSIASERLKYGCCIICHPQFPSSAHPKRFLQSPPSYGLFSQFEGYRIWRGRAVPLAFMALNRQRHMARSVFYI
ncbi:hypothetical protein MIND_00904900 [Mycena indigotica]|uniref:Uncharacterized protein n=1 Tax=Mycena indigotica TaxID=2126181 RepID=A0A8H6SC63_9AGAR|nr:uncharacterized protein MIND_00904900 [Mycena indigotica]KAF7296743.1 hypothetical protein MIND_00904900 [Mycena indigotica]